MQYKKGDRVETGKYGAGVVSKIKGKYIFVLLDTPVQHKRYTEKEMKFLAHTLSPEKKKKS